MATYKPICICRIILFLIQNSMNTWSSNDQLIYSAVIMNNDDNQAYHYPPTNIHGRSDICVRIFLSLCGYLPKFYQVLKLSWLNKESTLFFIQYFTLNLVLSLSSGYITIVSECWFSLTIVEWHICSIFSKLK